MTVQTLIALVIVALILLFLYLPNRIVDTTSCKRNWVATISFLACMCFLAGFDGQGWTLLTGLLSGIFINYTFPVLLNVLTAFNWKSDP